MSKATLDNTTTIGYFAALDNILGPEAGQSADPTSSNALLVNILGVGIDTAQVILPNDGLDYLRALMTFPLLYFQETWGSPTSPQYNDTAVVQGLLPDMYIWVEFSESQTRVVIPDWTIILYIVMLLGVYIWCVGCLVLSLFIRGPPTTPHEVLDFATMVSGCRAVDATAIEVLGRVGPASSKAYRKALANETLFVGSLVGERLVSLGSQEVQTRRSPLIFGITMNGTEKQVERTFRA
jgi:hypothetical protein